MIDVPSETVVAEYAVVPPLVVTLMMLPLVGAVMLLSTSRTVSSPGVPLKLAVGKNRTLVEAVRN